MTPQDVAKWMVEELHRAEYLHRETVVRDIARKFGDRYTYIDANGKPTIDKTVLRWFRKLTEKNVIWDRGARMWRFRNDQDGPGRQA